MENQAITELLLEVTRIEDLVAASSRGDQGSGETLRKIAHGFRTLADQPDRYDANDEDFRRLADSLETELDSVQKTSSNPDAAVDNLAARIGNVEVSDAVHQALLDSEDGIEGSPPSGLR